MKRTMEAIKPVVLPFATICVGDEVEVEKSMAILGQEMSTISIPTVLGLFVVQVPDTLIAKSFREVKEEQISKLPPEEVIRINQMLANVSKHGDKAPEQQPHVAANDGELGSLDWIKDLMSKLGSTPVAVKPTIKVKSAPAKFFVVTPVGEVLKTGDLVLVVGQLDSGNIIVTTADGRKFEATRKIYDHLVPFSEQAASTTISKMKRKHYLSQNFVASGGLLTKKINESQTQVVNESDYDTVRVLVDNEIAEVIKVSWGK